MDHRRLRPSIAITPYFSDLAAWRELQIGKRREAPKLRRLLRRSDRPAVQLVRLFLNNAPQARVASET